MTAFLRLMTPLPSPLQLLQTLLRVLATLSLGPASPLQGANSFLFSLPLKLWSSFHSQSHSLAQQSMINPGSEVRATSVLAHSSMSQFGQKGMLYTMETHPPSRTCSRRPDPQIPQHRKFWTLFMPGPPSSEARKSQP